LHGDARTERLGAVPREHLVVGTADCTCLVFARDLLAEDVDRRGLPVRVQPPDDVHGVLEQRPRDVGRSERAHEPPRNCRQGADDRAVEERHRRRILGLRRQLSRMNPWRAALTSATASGNSTRIASRRAIDCSSVLPVTCTCASAAEVSSTAVFSVSVANCSRWASCTLSACCSANSRRPRRRSSGSPPKGHPKPPPSMRPPYRRGRWSRASTSDTKASTTPVAPLSSALPKRSR